MEKATENINPSLLGLRKPLSELKTDPKNARKHPKRSIEAITASLSRFGQQKPIVILEDGTVIAGNGTLEAARDLGWGSLAVVSFTDSRKARAYALADNRSAELSEWDTEGLLESLSEIDDDLIGSVGFLPSEIEDIRLELHPEEPYVRTVESPIYSPSSKNPSISELSDDSKTQELIAEIDGAGLSQDISRFLRSAAERHTIFNFSLIADFYAQSDAKTQRLFENSALVIIDFNRATELGFVKLSSKLAELYAEDSRGE